MENRWQVAISAGLLAAVWCGIADAFHLVTWIGFLGCSTFFAQPKAGFQGVMMAWCTNLSGVFGLGSLSAVAVSSYRLWQVICLRVSRPRQCACRPVIKN